MPQVGGGTADQTQDRVLSTFKNLPRINATGIKEGLKIQVT